MAEEETEIVSVDDRWEDVVHTGKGVWIGEEDEDGCITAKFLRVVRTRCLRFFRAQKLNDPQTKLPGYFRGFRAKKRPKTQSTHERVLLQAVDGISTSAVAKPRRALAHHMYRRMYPGLCKEAFEEDLKTARAEAEELVGEEERAEVYPVVIAGNTYRRLYAESSVAVRKEVKRAVKAEYKTAKAFWKKHHKRDPTRADLESDILSESYDE